MGYKLMLTFPENPWVSRRVFVRILIYFTSIRKIRKFNLKCKGCNQAKTNVYLLEKHSYFCEILSSNSVKYNYTYISILRKHKY